MVYKYHAHTPFIHLFIITDMVVDEQQNANILLIDVMTVLRKGDV